MSQVSEALIHYVLNLHDAGFRIPDSSFHLPAFAMDSAARLMPGESARINLFNVHLDRVDKDFRPTLALRMNDKQQITWNLELPL
jgi:hypothetical protein